MALAGRDVRPVFADKEAVRRRVEELNREMGFTPDPDVTVEKVWTMMLAEGVRPEDNSFTRELMRMRYGDEYGDEQRRQ